jgi:hypothetical protein
LVNPNIANLRLSFGAGESVAAKLLAATQHLRNSAAILKGKTANQMSVTWNTKYGSRRVRHDPPTLKEAIAAAQDLSDKLQDQIEIAAGFMDLPVEDVRAEVMKTVVPRNAARIVTSSGREGGSRTVIVERKSRRIVRHNEM